MQRIGSPEEVSMKLKVVWPVDLFTTGDPLQKNTAATIATITQGVRDIEVQPVKKRGISEAFGQVGNADAHSSSPLGNRCFRPFSTIRLMTMMATVHAKSSGVCRYSLVLYIS